MLRKAGVAPSSSQVMQLLALPAHVSHEASHVPQLCVLPIWYWPTGQTKVHVPALESNTPPVAHDVQLVALPAEQAAQLEWHERHWPLDAYLPFGQLPTHAPLSKSGVPLDGQLRHSMLPGPEHCWHVAWQAVQRLAEPTTLTKVPSLGQLATQEPLCRKGSALPVQLRHSELEGPVHVPQLVSHAWQACELSAYLLTGVHEARQPPGGLEKGVAAAHVRQSFSVRPEQVAQLAWQDEQ